MWRLSGRRDLGGSGLALGLAWAGLRSQRVRRSPCEMTSIVRPISRQPGLLNLARSASPSLPSFPTTHNPPAQTKAPPTHHSLIQHVRHLCLPPLCPFPPPGLVRPSAAAPTCPTPTPEFARLGQSLPLHPLPSTELTMRPLTLQPHARVPGHLAQRRQDPRLAQRQGHSLGGGCPRRPAAQPQG